MDNSISKDKRERFKRLATYRTNQVINKLKVLSNCANTSAYDYTEEEVNKIFSVIDKKVKDAKSKFHYKKNDNSFKL